MNLRDLFLRIRALVAPHCVERELHEELTFHIERETQKHITAGLSPVHARSADRALWADLPTRYPSYQTCHQRFQQWVSRCLGVSSSE